MHGIAGRRPRPIHVAAATSSTPGSGAHAVAVQVLDLPGIGVVGKLVDSQVLGAHRESIPRRWTTNLKISATLSVLAHRDWWRSRRASNMARTPAGRMFRWPAALPTAVCGCARARGARCSGWTCTSWLGSWRRSISRAEGPLERLVARRHADHDRADPHGGNGSGRVEAARQMADGPRSAMVDLSRRLSISERQLRRRFERTIGLRPSSYARIARVQRAVRWRSRTGGPGPPSRTRRGSQTRRTSPERCGP